MLRLIVHGDDFGISRAVNAGILTAHREGILTSASIMAAGPAFEHAIEIAHSAPTLDIGVHLTLVEEMPVLESRSIPTLIEENGCLHKNARTFTKRYMMHRIRISEIRDELDAQIKKVANCGVKISHLDSHQHLHMLPQILRVVVDLANQYRIPAIRFPYEAIRRYMLSDLSEISRLLELAMLNCFCLLSRNTIKRRTDRFVGFFFSGRLNRVNLLQVLASLPEHGTCELMCHPGLDDPDNHYSHWGYHFSDELNALLDPKICRYLERDEIELVSYREFAKL